MAERAAQKPRKRTGKAADAAVGPRVRALEAERDRLKADLQAAQARIKALEQAREQALNRIDWVIDSLHNLGDE